MSNNLYPDQARQKVGFDLGPNCLQKLSADDKSHHKQVKRNMLDPILFFSQIKLNCLMTREPFSDKVPNKPAQLQR